MTDELLNDGHKVSAVAAGILDCPVLSGSLNPSTYLFPRVTNAAMALVMPEAVCSAPVWPQIIGTNSPPTDGLLHGASADCIQL